MASYHAHTYSIQYYCIHKARRARLSLKRGTTWKIRLGIIQESKYPAISWILGYDLLFFCILIVLITCCAEVEKLPVNSRAETYNNTLIACRKTQSINN